MGCISNSMCIHSTISNPIAKWQTFDGLINFLKSTNHRRPLTRIIVCREVWFKSAITTPTASMEAVCQYALMEREHPINLVHVTKPFIGITLFMTTYKMCIFTADIVLSPATQQL